MKKTRVASRYAKSLLNLAIEQGELENTYNDMKLISQTCHSSKDLTLLLKSPIVKSDKKTRILKEIFKDRLSKLSQSFIDIIIRKRREIYLEEITWEFQNQYKEYKNIITAVVTSASGLDDNIRSEIMKIVKESTSFEVELIEKKDKELIGGFVLRIGDKQIDKSIQNKLKELSRSFSGNPHIEN
ncbi:MAG: ATP synthase F1 subunit delta [Bacteroidota bacterium]